MPTTPPARLTRFEQVVRDHQAGLRAYIRALGAQDAWVDDLAQEVFLVAYRRLDHFIAGSDIGRWLRGIARNLVLNERRKHARHTRLLHGPMVDVLEPAGVPAAPDPLASGVLQVMAECVQQLPDRSRELLQRRYEANSDAAELGRRFRLSAAAVRQTLSRTRAAVRRCVGAKLGEAWL